VRVYGPTNTEGRGGAVTVNFYNKDGQIIDHRDIEAAANKENISLRTGCFCNPGAGEIALGISRVELDVCFTQPGTKSACPSTISACVSTAKPPARRGASRISVQAWSEGCYNNLSC
jgi:selenocysteine lyase/cysteine desulfurase